MKPEQVRNIAADLEEENGKPFSENGKAFNLTLLYELLMGLSDLWEAADDATHLHNSRGEVYECKTCLALVTLEKLKP